MDASNPEHFTRPECNFCKVQDYNFDSLDIDKTISATLLGSSYLEKLYVLSMKVGSNAMSTLPIEDNGSLHVKGSTSNGALMQISLNGKQTAVFEDICYVNLPPRPGYALKVQGPVLRWANLESYNCDEPDEAEAILRTPTGKLPVAQDIQSTMAPYPVKVIVPGGGVQIRIGNGRTSLVKMHKIALTSSRWFKH